MEPREVTVESMTIIIVRLHLHCTAIETENFLTRAGPGAGGGQPPQVFRQYLKNRFDLGF